MLPACHALVRLRSYTPTVMKRALAPLVLLSLMPVAEAARPFLTDDARLTTAGSCQLESWVRAYRNSTELWALPACNPTGNVEVTVGGGSARPASGDGSWTDDYVFQAKTLMRELRPGSWGAGIAVGTIRHPQVNPGPNLLGNTYAYLPLSMAFAGDTLVVHLNVGWLRDRATRASQGTWGVGAELNLNPHWTLIAESFGNTTDTPYWQAGARYHLIPGLFQIDATAGRRFGGDRDAQWLSFGLRLTPERLF